MSNEPSQEEINELRNAVLQKIKSGNEDVHPKDLERLKTDDDWIRRFLKHNELKQDESLDMIWNALQWRRENAVNDITEQNISMDILISGGLFSRGKDIDGADLLIFKAKKHVKNVEQNDEIRKCVIYWMERMERQSNGKPITLFFDMEKCGLSNMDLDFTKYIIDLFKYYYPYFLNYVLVYEMAWILNACFRVIKSWLPEKAVKKIKFVSRKDLKEWVPLDQALECWGGEDNYTYSFVPEGPVPEAAPTSRKVRFDDGTQMSDVGSANTASGEDGCLLRVISPEDFITFTKEQDNEYICNLVLQNISTCTVSYKVKTTTPEKFRVRPGIGVLEPDAKATISVCLLSAYKKSNIAKDKFLIQSTAVSGSDLSTEELSKLWKHATCKKENQIHLRCSMGDNVRNGTIFNTSSEVDPQLGKVTATLQEMRNNQIELNHSIKSMMYIQISLLVLLIAAVLYLITTQSIQNQSANEESSLL